MKKLTIFLIFISYLFSETKISQLSSDQSVKKSEREIIVTISKLGMSDYSYDLPVEFCPVGDGKKDADCYFVGNWKGSFSKGELDSIIADEVDNLVSQKYDKINFISDKVQISTATKNVEFSAGKNIEFQFYKGSETKFKNDINKYLNKVSNTLQDSLNRVLDSRYKEMDEKNQISFIRTNGKSKDVSVEVAKKLLNSAFAFSFYYGKIDGKIVISENIVDVPAIGKRKYYSTSVNIGDSLKLIISEFQDGKFDNYKTIIGGGSSFGSALSLVGLDSKSSTTVSKPDSETGKEIIKDVFATIIKEAMANLRVQIKQDRQFQVKAPIIQVDGNSLTLGIGCQQDIRTDHPFNIERVVDGEIEHIGFAKIRDRGNNCLSLSENLRENSIASAITGSYELYDLAFEQPWSGVFYSQSVGFEDATFSLDQQSIGGGNRKFLTFSIVGDLGYILDSSILSEIWFDLSFGGGLMDNLYLDKFHNIEITAKQFAISNFSLFKRFYLGSIGFYTDFGLKSGSKIYSYEYKDKNKNIDTTLTFENLIIDPFLRLGYNFSPNFELFGNVGYSIPLSTKYEFQDKVEKDPFLNGDLTTFSGINLSFGFLIHMNFIGGLSKIFAPPPSNRCKR